MLKLRKRLLIGLLSAAIILSTGQTMVWSDGEPSTAATGEEGESVTGEPETGGESDTTGSDSKEDEVTLVTEEQALAAMVKYCENSKYALYIQESEGQFAVENKSNGYVWFSSPINADNDPVAKSKQKATMKSMFYFTSADPASVENTTKITSNEGSVSKDGLTVEKIDNGCKFIFYFPKQKITINVYVTIDETGLSVNIPVGEIKEESAEATSAGGAKLVDLTLLENFGAAGSDETGYIVVPDGSGAVINFNNKKTNASIYSAFVYGRDLSISATAKPAKTETVNLPIVGMVKDGASGDNAMLAVLTSGDESAKVNASVAGQSTTSYNATYFSFVLRTSDKYFMGSSNKALSVLEQGDIKTGDLTAKYYFMSGDNLSYVDVAKQYQEHLMKVDGLTVKTKAESSPYYLTVYGGTKKIQSILGFPMELQTAATTYKQAVEIMTLLQNNGVDDIALVYNDFNNSGIEGTMSTGLDYASILGGEGDFKTLKDYIAENEFTFYPSLDFMEFKNSGNGYSFSLNSAKQITKSYSSQLPYDLAYGIPHYTKTAWTVISPYYWPDIFTKMVKSFTKESVVGISLNQGTSTLYSDFSRKSFDGTDYFSRSDAAALIVDGLKLMNANNLKVLAQGCNAYALPYVSEIVNVPAYSSNYDLFDYDIPFYQIVIHGVIPYSTKPINENANKQELLMLSLSTATPIHYDMMYSSPNDLTDSEYEKLYYALYEGWIASSADEYKTFKEIITSLSDKQITNYEYLTSTIVKSTFSNGTTIEVDLEKETAKVNGTIYDLSNYGLKGEAVNE